MGKYYILSVDSFQNSFSMIDSLKQFEFEYQIQDKSDIVSELKKDDIILVYRKAPISGINIVLKVSSDIQDTLKFIKVIEVCQVTNVSVENLDLENSYINEISGETFNMIYKKMISVLSFNDVADVNDEIDFKDEFKKFITEVLGLKSVRQVRDLEVLSNMMEEAGVIDKSIYRISDVEEYQTTVENIRESLEYINYKNERKSVSPNSGLACDQGMTNYEKFLIYLNEKSKEKTRVTGAENILLYGVPGAGKSNTIKEEYCSDQKYFERVVFHPDYTYSDFVGQILPRVHDEELKYEFTPGPFTKIMKKAWNDPENMYYLIIEEINRGNAPAIFGEIFQLLDRKDADKYSQDVVGESEYGIVNFDVAKEIYGYEEHQVFIPSNLYILATMNTADQNVFTLDTAFQRRWKMKHIKNDVLAAKHADKMIEGSEISWGSFALVVNEKVVDVNSEMASSEDKRLGAYFAKEQDLKEDAFPEKVLKYLWDDAFKYDKEQLFSKDFKSLDKVIEAYRNASDDKLKAILRLDIYARMFNQMKKGMLTENGDESQGEG